MDEGGASHWVVEDGEIRNIDNWGADDPEAQMGLDCHSHTGKPPLEDGVFRNVLVENCASGLTITSPEPGLIDDIRAENITVRNIVERVHILAEADTITLSECSISVDEDGDFHPRGYNISGGDVTLENCDATGAQYFNVYISDGRIPLTGCTIDSGVLDGDGVTNHNIDISSIDITPEIANVEMENTVHTSLRAEDDNLHGSEWGLILRGITADNDIQVSDSGNAPVLVEDSSIDGNVTLPEGSSTEAE